MTLILMGLILWSALHALPATKPRIRSTLIKTLKPPIYASLYALAIIGSIVLMVMGWRSGVQWTLYMLPPWTFAPGVALVATGALLFGFGFVRTMKSNLKRHIRHPQLIGLLFWSLGHLLLNGDNLSVLLFGGLAVWALVMRALVNKRDGAWAKPDIVPLGREIAPAAVALAFVLAFVFGHSWLSGIPLIASF